MATIAVSIGHDQVPIDRGSFALLCDNSVIADRADVRHALQRSKIRYVVLEELARAAEIPVALFLAAPQAVRFLLDTVVLSKITPVQRSSEFVRERCRIPTAVLTESQGLPDASNLAAIEYETTAEVLRQVPALVHALEPGDRLLDLYRNEGNGDIFLLAVALVEIDVLAGQLFGDRWVIATDDRGLTAKAASYGVATCTSAGLVGSLNEWRLAQV